MGNIPAVFRNLKLNGWTPENKLLIWRTISMCACIIGTAVYMIPLEPYIEIPFFGIMVPAFITGYMLVHSTDILLLVMSKDYIFLETCFVIIGAIGSLVCGVYQFHKWIEWLNDVSHDPNQDYDIPDLVLALAFLVHFLSLCAVEVHRIFQLRESLNQ